MGRINKEKDKEEEDNENSNSKDDSGLDMNFLGLLKNPLAYDKKFGVQKLTLAALLEVLDGVMEMEGRMLIITTNYPEKLDKALIRPGRIDMKVHFGAMTGENIIEMYKHYFNDEPPLNVPVHKLPDLKWTPAGLLKCFLTTFMSPKKLI